MIIGSNDSVLDNVYIGNPWTCSLNEDYQQGNDRKFVLGITH